jgi:hypothetical protein
MSIPDVYQSDTIQQSASLWYRNGVTIESMDESKPKSSVARSIRLPQVVWDALDADAEENRRSSVKQLETILVDRYHLFERRKAVLEAFQKAVKHVATSDDAMNSWELEEMAQIFLKEVAPFDPLLEDEPPPDQDK